MDFAMPRKDFDRLLKIGPGAFQSPLFFQTPVTEKGRYFRAFARIRNSEGTAAFKEEYDLGINCGIFIDIFCLDEIPDSAWKRNLSILLFSGTPIRLGYLKSIRKSPDRMLVITPIASPIKLSGTTHILSGIHPIGKRQSCFPLKILFLEHLRDMMLYFGISMGTICRFPRINLHTYITVSTRMSLITFSSTIKRFESLQIGKPHESVAFNDAYEK